MVENMIKNNKIFNTCYNKAGGVLFCVFMAAFFAVFGASSAQAQTAMVTEVSVNYPDDSYVHSVAYNGTDERGYQCQLLPDSSLSDLKDVSFFIPDSSNAELRRLDNNMDPWHNSALIEFDQPFFTNISSIGNGNYYPNQCLNLCAQVTCANPARKTDGSTGTSSSTLNTTYDVASSDFPIQSVLFEIFKYQPNSNPYNADSTPPIRTIALTPVGSTGANTCYGVGVSQTGSAGDIETESCCDVGCVNDVWGTTTAKAKDSTTICNATCQNFKSYENCKAGTTILKFCAAWDGSYEIDGEFGKSNGQFGFRANVQTKWPGDGVSSGDVEVNHTMAYPGIVSSSTDTDYATVAQIPIQVDVTNVHSEVKVTGNNHVGGLVGYFTGNLSASSVKENVVGQDSVGGLVG